MFLPIALLVYYISPKKLRNLILFILSIIFYAWGEPIYVVLILFLIIFDYLSALIIGKYRERNKFIAKSTFLIMILFNIGVLGFFKYFEFIINNINVVFGVSWSVEKLPLPIGISFYTFQIISYAADVYLGKVKAEKNIINFGTYITMFPQLASGPIMKFGEIGEQLRNRKENLENFTDGIERFIVGLGKKVLIANNVGLIWTVIKNTPIGEISVVSAWLGIIAFTLQIYFDFSGYSDMAIGVGKMMGFELIENFRYPYLSTSVSEFWRRWHISLGRWFKDYLYIPLGGNRVSKLKQVRNLFIVWFITGLWHGASWNFIFWGIYFGIFVFIEKMFLGNLLKKMPKVISNMYTMIVVIIGWVFFDIYKFGEAINYIKTMFGVGTNKFIDNAAMYYLYTNAIVLILAIVCATPIISNIQKNIKKKQSLLGAIIMGICYIGILFLSTSYLVNQSFSPFLYFKF